MNSPQVVSFTTPQVARIIGEPYRKVISYIERGYVIPSIQDARGSGSKRLWSYMDVIKCLVVKGLLEWLSVDRVRTLAQDLVEEQLQRQNVLVIYKEGWDLNPGGVLVVENGVKGLLSSEVVVALTGDHFEKFDDLHVIVVSKLHEVALNGLRRQAGWTYLEGKNEGNTQS